MPPSTLASIVVRLFEGHELSLILGIAGIFYSLYFTVTHHGSGFDGFYDKTALVLLLLMPPSVMLLSHTITDFYVGLTILLKALFRTQGRREKEVIEVLTASSALVRAEGIGALMKVRNRVKYPFLRDGLSLILNDFSSEEIRHNLQNKINAEQMRMSLASNLFENISKLSPGVGMIGTLVGLISMMANLKNPDQIGAGMALAMIGTLYGLLLGTLIYGPFSEKISLEAERNLQIDLMILEGILTLKGKKSSIHMRDIMNTYSQRKNVGGQGQTEAAKRS